MKRSKNIIKSILLSAITLCTISTLVLQAARSSSPYSTPRPYRTAPSTTQQSLELGRPSQELTLLPLPPTATPSISPSTRSLTTESMTETMPTPTKATTSVVRPTLTSSLQGLETLSSNIKEMNELKDDPAMIMFALKTLAQFITIAAPGYGPQAMAVTQAAQTLYPLVINMGQLLTKMGVLKGESVQVLKDALHELSANIDQNIYDPITVQALITIATGFIENKAVETWPQESPSLKSAAQNIRALLDTIGMGPDRTKPINEDALRDAQQTLIRDDITIKGIRYWAPSKKEGRDIFFILKPLVEKIINKKLYLQGAISGTVSGTMSETSTKTSEFQPLSPLSTVTEVTEVPEVPESQLESQSV